MASTWSTENRPDSSAPGVGLQRTGRQRRSLWLLLMIAGLVVIPAAFWGIPAEIARWKMAQALCALTARDTPRALTLAKEATGWDPDAVDLLRYRAILYRSHGDLTNSLAEIDRILQQFPHHYWSLQFRISLLQRMGRFHEAIPDHDQLVADAADRWSLAPDDPQQSLQLAVALNNRAYFRAMAGVELGMAYDEINQAIELSNPWADHVFLDTRGYIRFLRGEFVDALGDLEAAVYLAEADFNRRRDHLVFESTSPASQIRDEIQWRQELAVIYQHRGRVMQALGHDLAAQADLNRAQELGYDAEAGM